MTETQVRYRKREDAWLSGRETVLKAEADPIPYFEVGGPDRQLSPEGKAGESKWMLGFSDVFPATVAGPTNLGDAPNAVEADGENTEVRRGDRGQDWTNGAGSAPRSDADGERLPSTKENKYDWGAGRTFSADGDWLYKDATDPTPQAVPMRVPARLAPVSEPPPSLDEAHAGQAMPSSTGDWLDKGYKMPKMPKPPKMSGGSSSTRTPKFPALSSGGESYRHATKRVSLTGL